MRVGKCLAARFEYIFNTSKLFTRLIYLYHGLVDVSSTNFGVLAWSFGINRVLGPRGLVSCSTVPRPTLRRSLGADCQQALLVEDFLGGWGKQLLCQQPDVRIVEDFGVYGQQWAVMQASRRHDDLVGGIAVKSAG